MNEFLKEINFLSLFKRRKEHSFVFERFPGQIKIFLNSFLVLVILFKLLGKRKIGKFV
jgi:hypothetical protein